MREGNKNYKPRVRETVMEEKKSRAFSMDFDKLIKFELFRILKLKENLLKFRYVMCSSLKKLLSIKIAFITGAGGERVTASS